MTDNGNQFHAEHFREVISPLEDHADWMRTEDATIETAVERATADALGELFYRHQPSTAQLHIRMPKQGTPQGLLHAILDQPLDPQLPQTGDPGTFTAMLSNAHRVIAEKHATAYITPKKDPHMVLTVAVPVDYDSAMFETTIEAIGLTADVVEQLHTDITHSITAYLE